MEQVENYRRGIISAYEIHFLTESLPQLLDFFVNTHVPIIGAYSFDRNFFHVTESFRFNKTKRQETCWRKMSKILTWTWIIVNI